MLTVGGKVAFWRIKSICIRKVAQNIEHNSTRLHLNQALRNFWPGAYCSGGLKPSRLHGLPQQLLGRLGP